MSWIWSSVLKPMVISSIQQGEEQKY
jgi:hypothetical protein